MVNKREINKRNNVAIVKLTFNKLLFLNVFLSSVITILYHEKNLLVAVKVRLQGNQSNGTNFCRPIKLRNCYSAHKFLTNT